MEKNESVDGVLNQKLLIIWQWLQQKPHPDFSENNNIYSNINFDLPKDSKHRKEVSLTARIIYIPEAPNLND